MSFIVLATHSNLSLFRCRRTTEPRKYLVSRWNDSRDVAERS